MDSNKVLYIWTTKAKDEIITLYDITKTPSKFFHSIFYSFTDNLILKIRNKSIQRKDLE